MSKYNETILTAGGLDLATRAANGKTKFTITKATATADDLTAMSEAELQNLTVLPNEIQTGSITNQTENIPNSKSVVGTEILFTNQGIDKGYLVNAVGLYAKEDGKDEEILYALNTAVEPEFMPDFVDQVLLQFKITMYVIVGRTENVTVTLDPTATATKDYVDTKVAEIDVNDDIENQDILSSLSNRLAYTDYISKDKNKLTQVAEALTKIPRGLKSVDSEGKITEYSADSDLLVDISKIMSDSGNSNGVMDEKASIYNGSISGRYQYWHGNSSLIGKTKIIFERAAGAKLAYIGDGFQIKIIMKKTLVTRGAVESTSSDIPIYYDSENKIKEGYYVTTIKIPINIKLERLLTGKEIIVQITGVGETGSSSKEVKSPELHVQYTESDNSISVWQEKGYEYDDLSDTKTGAIYDLSVTYINSYYVQDPIAQLPSDIGLFSGTSSGEIKLSGTGNYFDNLNTGINITTDEYLSFTPINAFIDNEVDNLRILSSVLNIPTKFTISKNDLIVGNRINIPGQITQPRYLNVQITTSNSIWTDYNVEVESLSFEDTFIQVNEGSIQIYLTVKIKAAVSQHAPWESTGTLKVLTIKKV